MIINKELGISFNENPWQGSFAVDYLTERGGVLGAMDTMCQRGKIEEESMYYEHKKHDGSLPLVGVNTFLPKEHVGEVTTEIELIRSTPEEKGQQIGNVRNWQENRNKLAPRGETSHSHEVETDGAGEEAHDGHGLGYLQKTARERKNVFEALMEAVKTHSLGRSRTRCMTWVGRIGGLCEQLRTVGDCIVRTGSFLHRAKDVQRSIALADIPRRIHSS